MVVPELTVRDDVSDCTVCVTKDDCDVNPSVMNEVGALANCRIMTGPSVVLVMMNEMVRVIHKAAWLTGAAGPDN